MTKHMEIYKCLKCGNIIEVLHTGVGSLVCCDEPMKLITENTVDAAKEKHIPVIEKKDNGVLIKVGSVAHPMQPEHYIEWIEVVSENMIHRTYLKPGQTPEAFFTLPNATITAREYCNLHGLWRTA